MSLLRTIITQGLTLPAIIASEKWTLMLDSTKLLIDGRTEIQSPMSHHATSGCDKKHILSDSLAASPRIILKYSSLSQLIQRPPIGK